jgi:hypothetical protein
MNLNLIIILYFLMLFILAVLSLTQKKPEGLQMGYQAKKDKKVGIPPAGGSTVKK